MNNNTLARGAALTPDTWADFVTRLRHDHIGEGVRDHCTADAIFTVQARRIVSGIDTDYTDKLLVHNGESDWKSPLAFWDDHDDEMRKALDKKARSDHGKDFLSLTESQQWDILGDLKDHAVVGWSERWEHINSHFTKDAAEAFIERKKHDYRDGIQVYVESQHHAWEFNTIKAAILAGKLVYSEVTNG